MNVKDSILDVIGETPLLELRRLEKYFSLKARIFAKLERTNPTGSIKDRIAKEMILLALKRGEITKDTVIVEPTSGNTGIGLAAISATLGMKCAIFMPSNCSIERIKIMKAFGADIRLVDAKGGMSLAIEEAKKYASSLPSAFIPSQFTNCDNSLAHYKTTGPEIYRDLDGDIDIFIASFGTGGTLTGTSRYLKEQNKNIISIGVEPENSPFINEGKKGPHKIQGIGAGFKPDVLDLNYVDKVVEMKDDGAYEFTRLLARKEGIFVGISSGANVCALVRFAKDNPGRNLVTVLPDNGERYLSVPGLFE